MNSQFKNYVYLLAESVSGDLLSNSLVRHRIDPSLKPYAVQDGYALFTDGRVERANPAEWVFSNGGRVTFDA